MPIDYSKYPPDWKEIRERILKRAGNQCEECGLKNYAIGYRSKKGTFYSIDYLAYQLNEFGNDFFADELSHIDIDDMPIKIILTIAHLDHDEENHNVKDDRLKALCQRCHLIYDVPEKKKRLRNKKAIKDFFD